MVMIYKE